MHGLRSKYFSVDMVFYNYSVAMQTKIMLSSVIKNSQNGNFADFIDLNQKNKFGRSCLILLQPLALYFALYIADNIQVAVKEKKSSVYLKDFPDFFNTDVFFTFFDKCLFTYSMMQSPCFTPSCQSWCWLGKLKHNASDYIGKMFLNLNFISNIFQETHDLNFDRFGNYLYLFKKKSA